jgi:hypothetical protein
MPKKDSEKKFGSADYRNKDKTVKSLSRHSKNRRKEHGALNL